MVAEPGSVEALDSLFERGLPLRQSPRPKESRLPAAKTPDERLGLVRRMDRPPRTMVGRLMPDGPPCWRFLASTHLLVTRVGQGWRKNTAPGRPNSGLRFKEVTVLNGCGDGGESRA